MTSPSIQTMGYFLSLHMNKRVALLTCLVLWTIFLAQCSSHCRRFSARFAQIDYYPLNQRPMKRLSNLLLFCLLGFTIHAQFSDDAQWISVPALPDSQLNNRWLAFEKMVELEDPAKQILAKVAADTKYWMWVNDRLIVREGGLKWGPVKDGYYYDQLDLGPYLKAGRNKIAVLVWYFGKSSMSHRSSGKARFRFEAPSIQLFSDSTWQGGLHPAFLVNSTKPHPNWRLSESNIYFDARKLGPLSQQGLSLWGADPESFTNCIIVAEEPPLAAKPRPIPFWKDFGLTSFTSMPAADWVSTGDTIILDLPYNMQCTPYFEIEAEAGHVIDIRTDNYKGGSEYNLRSNYITQKGRQVFESPAWMNGHEMRFHFPKGIKILALKYRESGYASEFAGGFSCSDAFYDKLWEKAVRTLYITMRDNYMDCPDRERGQWWGDVVLEMGETFYALDRRSDALSRKAILELMEYQKEDGVLFSPIPAGNWEKELPTQMLASVGYYGIWTYYWYTGDKRLLEEVYPRIKRYLSLWELDENDLVMARKGGWLWGDWGKNKDMPLLFNGWYYLALKAQVLMAETLGKKEDAGRALALMGRLKPAFQKAFWRGDYFQSASHLGPPDERGNALAVLCGFVDHDDFNGLKKVLLEGKECSPYFEKYVEEALFQMGYANEALSRMKERFSAMVESPLTTLWEGWDIGSATWGGGTYNHAWSGGGLTLLAQYIAGIQVKDTAWRKVLLQPQLGHLEQLDLSIQTIKGKLSVDYHRINDQRLQLDLVIPSGTEVSIKMKRALGMPKKITNISVLDQGSSRSTTYTQEEDVSLAVGTYRLFISYQN